MPRSSSAATSSTTSSSTHHHSVWPGLIVCAVIGLVCIGLSKLVPNLSAMLVAIILGVVARNTINIPVAFDKGIGVAAKSVLRWGVVLLGLQVSLGEILGLGWGVLITVIACVAITFVSTIALGKALKVDHELTTLIAAGFSICGAAAVAGAQGVVRATQEKVAAAVALVVLFGTLMIPSGLLIINVFGLGDTGAGIFIGGSTHEVAQVVATGGIAGGGALLTTAITVKLARVACLAPVIMSLSATQKKGPAEDSRPPLLPLFVVGFIAMMLIATTGWVPESVMGVAHFLQQFLLATAMFALGLGVHFKSLIKLGGRPVILGALSTVIICAVALIGVALVA
ncbi:YeiH family protein [Corynebacterium renale]|uniref:Putative integral membrane protein (TIGR00698 family) n=1 Tax=Corynebacterium renale TaxID=1724 RepID=A0A2A9DRI7_9CORY|nr:putative sulfate exporter family transporter [Corynebacterium renale]PFG29001.1 putative integral membrane protein (TIGR00698 family) [Corynebacterium renale]SQI25445.1 uncharacterized membrane protein [Corynebacterium renale]